MQDLAEVSHGDDSRRRPLHREVAQHSAQQANAVCSQRSLPKLIYDAQRPAHKYKIICTCSSGTAGQFMHNMRPAAILSLLCARQHFLDRLLVPKTSQTAAAGRYINILYRCDLYNCAATSQQVTR